MWKRIWGALDSLLSAVGFATLVLVGFRHWRGLPISPWPSAPSTVPVAIAPSGSETSAAPQAGATALAPIKPLGESDNAIETTAPWRQGAPGASGAAPTADAGSPSGSPGGSPSTSVSVPPLKQAHDWSREISVTVNASRYVKSLADLAPPPASLPEAARRELQAAQAGAKGSEMLLVCNVTVEYSGSEEVTLDQSGFRLVSPERQVYPAVAVPFSTRDLQPLRATLLANGSAKGDLVFPVKRGVQPDEVLYNPS